jgi:octaprenyl-diphosphate synthase
MKENLKQTILTAVADDLADIEQALVDNLTPYLDRVREIAGHILFSGGKRIRPLLMILSARICGYEKDDAATFAILFEYLHTATLLHDDLVDFASVRRGKPVANVIWGNASAVLTGDFLLARASSLAVRTREMEILEILARITEDMSQGELHQLARKGDSDLSEKEYLKIIRNKTAVLMQGACLSGAILAGAAPEQKQALSDYGLNLGMAFQMTDDLLDYTSDSEELGKAVGADLREGKFTLPLIASLARAGRDDAKKMKDIMNDRDFSIEAFQALNRLLDQYGGIAYTRACAADYVEKAKAALSAFASSTTGNLLAMLADYTLMRNS